MQAHRDKPGRGARIAMTFVFVAMVVGIGALMPSPAEAAPGVAGGKICLVDGIPSPCDICQILDCGPCGLLPCDIECERNPQTCEQDVPCGQTERGCPSDPCAPPKESIGDKCYPPLPDCPPPSTIVDRLCVPPVEEPEPQAQNCTAPATLVNGACTEPQALVAPTTPTATVLGVVVSRAPVAPAAPELPRTGDHTAELLALGMVLSVAGWLAMVTSRSART